MNKTRHAFLVAIATSLTLPAIAEEQSPIIVTATRTAQTADETLASVTVITKEQIAQQQANDLTELLSSIAGIDMVNNGGFGKSTSLYMRGTNTGHTLVLIDGVKIGSATLGQVSYQDIPVELIERIEIVRGARATLYGSDAIGGVIQIFTKKPANNTQTNFSAMRGSYNTNKLSAGISGNKNNTSYSLQASSFSTDGFNSRQNNDQDLDGYGQQSFSLFLKQQINKTDFIEASLLQSSGVNEYDGSTITTDYKAETLQEAFGVKSVFNALPNWQVTLNANESQDKSDELENNVKKDEFNTKRIILNWQNDLTLNKNNLLTIGVEQKNTSISGTSAHTKKSRDNSAVFLQHNWSSDESDILVSLRGDNNEAFGKHNTGSISWGKNIFNDTRIILSAATAFKAPSFNDLYYPSGAFSSGNPDVLPEESENFEFSIKQNNLQFNVYNTTIKNLIAWDNATGKWIPSNVAAAKITGVELLASVMLDGWNTQINLALTDPVDTATGKVLKNRSRESVRLDFDKDFSSYSLGATIKFQGKRYSTNELPEYTLIDLRANYKINKNWDLKGKITNALNRSYQASDGYNSPDRSIFISIAYTGF